MTSAVETEAQAETGLREPTVMRNLRGVLSLAIGLFILWTAISGPFDALIQRSLMLALVVTLGFLTFPLRIGGRIPVWAMVLDAVLWLGAVSACLYVTASSERIMTTLPLADAKDMAMTAILVLTLLELARRAVGIVFPILITIGFLYVFFGDRIPGALGHRGYDVYFVTETLLLSDIGIWGTLTGIAATVIAAFVLFGAMLLRTGGGETFMDLAILVSGRRVGGAAKIATIASAAFGTVNGSAVANVATTGSMTIPLMKRIGYPAPLAAAVEAVASTGGQITPPILGAAAFIMAEIVGVDYLRIALAALIPAILFYAGALTTIHLIALRNNYGVVPPEDIPPAREVLTPLRLFPILGGIGGLMFMLLSGRSVAFSAAIGVVCMVVPFIIGDLFVNRDPKGTGRKLLGGLSDSGSGIVIVFVMLAGAQVLVSLINMTGVGVTISALTIAIGGQNEILVGLIVALACLVLGMGIPTTAAYVLVAAVMAPALIAINVEPLAAHMFVFYYATISVITPPLCVAVFVAASIAGTSWWGVALNAVRLGAVTYVVPFMFLTYPGMLWSGSGFEIAEAALSGFVLIVAFALLLSGSRIRGSKLASVMLYAPAAILAIIPSHIALIVAIVLTITGIVVAQPFRARTGPVAA
ncbi:TRAP transporter permease [Jiella pelagia]|uniref:TRAP transporter fused permease subunit n=1 Tax=Jiella pelagia TaxID=2986949 RepID=A0ABY7C2G9_9HYPH|nr:TRAP transporter fused permease subunit [Jiella pelagia]WAP69827.1 TRAP transporter fused permease subunit [Jiella pelagia]